MEWKSKIGIAVLLVGVWFTSQAVATVTVTEELGSGTYGLGQTIISTVMAEIPLEEPVLGWGIDFDWDDAVVQLVGYTVNDLLWDEGFAPDDPGVLDIAALSFPANVTGNALLVTFEFLAVGIGETDFTFGDDNPPDLTEGFALDPTGFAEVVYTPGHFTVIPEPGSLALLALGGLALLRRR